MKFLLISFFFISASTHAKIDNQKLNGSWISNCIQSQIYSKLGHVKEIYTFEGSSFVFKREWYKDSKCQKISTIDTVQGDYQIGDRAMDPKHPSNTFQVEFITKGQSKQGLLWVNTDHTNLRISRDYGDNSILGIFIYSKQK
ncbi:hypothetical protein ACJVC5_02210 [Peredibacter sp. HCB2-198]|uniref:hypothetical protein n=1 Tax=Peredibacter sp. HCB2-198 TaxID=3383025 RepID=UPI0038B5CE6F